MARVAQSATVVTLAAAADRHGVIIHNDAAAELRVKFGAGASLTDYAIAIPPSFNYESPVGGAFFETIFSGGAGDAIITGIWAAAGAGAAQVTEV